MLFYAYDYHHSKEERLLGEFLKDRIELLDETLEEHKRSKQLIDELQEAIGASDYDRIRETLATYYDLIMMHHQKEEERLYPFMDDVLILGGRWIFPALSEIEKGFGDSPVEFEEFAEGFNQRINSL